MNDDYDDEAPQEPGEIPLGAIAAGLLIMAAAIGSLAFLAWFIFDASLSESRGRGDGVHDVAR